MTTSDKWPCGGDRWECPTDGLQWCTWCNETCEECGQDRPRWKADDAWDRFQRTPLDILIEGCYIAREPDLSSIRGYPDAFDNEDDRGGMVLVSMCMFGPAGLAVGILIGWLIWGLT